MEEINNLGLSTEIFHKIENAIAYFAKKDKTPNVPGLPQTKLYKYLAYIEFDSIECLGVPAFNLTYKALDQGPVPMLIYEAIKECNFESNLFYITVNDNHRYIHYNKKAKVDLDYFSDFEYDDMNRILEIYAPYTAKDMCKGIHEQVIAWRTTRERDGENQIVKYEYQLPNIFIKNHEISYAEERFLTYKAFEELSKSPENIDSSIVICPKCGEKSDYWNTGRIAQYDEVIPITCLHCGNIFDVRGLGDGLLKTVKNQS